MRFGFATRLITIVFAGALPLTVLAAEAAKPPAAKADASSLARGKYLVVIGGCNDCHTAVYAMTNGKVPEKDWLMGDKLGWRGPWGTTYAVNLRQYMQTLTEAQWVAKAKALETRPPMPWDNIRAMTVQDLRAIYRYVRHLGPAGDAAPAYVPPDKEPSPPYVTFPAPPK
ncbi:MAG TPA: cytochrome C [Casimicrobiaceae bacterium]|jgi:mono/diheme cytochrome c family protein|nr:cytochrome C [Casimicrobiaceae bacterium]